jgi:hypothetical protein
MSLRRYNVGAVKIPYADRDVAHAVITADNDHGYRDILGSATDDEDERHPVGAHVVYTVELSDTQADQFRGASNLRYLELDDTITADRAVARYPGAGEIPTLATLAHLRARYLPLTRWHGRDVPVAVLDSGTTQAVRDAMGWTLVDREVLSGITIPDGHELYADTHTHGCLVAPSAVPAGGQLLDGIITGTDASAAYSAIAAGITWAVDGGARVINLSYSADNSGALAANASQAVLDAVDYAAAASPVVHIVMSAGNSGAAAINYPASIAGSRANVHSSIAFDESTDRRALFSNHAATGSGCAAGVNVAALTIAGEPTLISGTSFSSPLMAQLIARGASGGTYTVAQVAAALRANPRDTGAASSEQGAGAWDLQRALAALGGASSAGSGGGAGAATVVDATGGAGLYSYYRVDTPAGIAVDDVRIAVLVTSAGAALTVPSGWTLWTDGHYYGGDETAAGQTVGPTRVRVLAKPYTDDEPDTTFFRLSASWFSAITVLTLRGAGGFDPELFAPVVKFGTSASGDTLPVLPVSAADLLVTVHAQRHPAATTATWSTPTGLTSRGFWRPTSGSTGYSLRLCTAQLASGARTAAYTATSNSATSTWCTVAFTVPPTPAAVATVVQSEPAGPDGGASLFLPRS